MSSSRLALCILIAAGGVPCAADILDDALLKIGATRASLAVDTSVRERDAFRLDIVDELMAQPLGMPAYVHATAAALANADGLAAMLAAASRGLGVEVAEATSGGAPGLGKLEGVPQPLHRDLARLVAALRAAEQLRVQAFAGLSAQDSKRLDAGWRFFVEKVRGEENVEAADPALMEAARKVDLGKLLAAGAVAASGVDSFCERIIAWRAGLAAEDFWALQDLHCEVDTPAGKLVVNGTGSSEVREGGAIVVDLGGDDTYLCPVGFGKSGISVCVDVSGCDRYECVDDGAFGVGLRGVGILVDLGGMDCYRANDLSMGAGLFGVGVLWDRGGEDLYEGGQFTSGAAYFGAGILRDEGRDDRYSARWLAQGAGGPRGFGALVDRGGDDNYYCGGRYYGWSTSRGTSRSGCQGYAEGIRRVASGGIGLLVDTAGDDIYVAGSLSQGFGYWFGLGCLVDRAGNDTYQSPHYAQGSSVHLGLGGLFDHAGDDRYLGEVTTQGTAYDWSFAMLVDYGGEDYYRGRHLATGAGGINGSALLIDNAGDDVYDGGEPKAIWLGGGQPVKSRGWGSIGVFIDCDGDDEFPTWPEAKGTTWVKTSVGVGMDVNGAEPPFALTMSVAEPVATEVREPAPVVTIPEGRSREVAEACYGVLSVPGYAKELVEEAKARFYAMPEHSLPVCIEHLTAVPFYQVFPNIRTILPGFGEAAVAPLLKELAAEDPLRRAHAVYALGNVETTLGNEQIVAACSDEHEWVRAAAALSLGKRKPEGAADVLLPMLNDDAPEVRLKAAQALGEIGDAAAAEALAGNLADASWKASDGAATALVKLGEAALGAVRAFEQETEDAAVKTRCQRVIEAIEADQEA